MEHIRADSMLNGRMIRKRGMGQLRKMKGGRVSVVMAMVVLVFGTLSACLKDGDGVVSQISAVRALNAVPGSTGLDIGLDQNQLNDPLLDGQFAYADTLPYKNAWPGNRLVRVYTPIRNPSTPPLAQGTVGFTPGRFYSLYVAGYTDIELVATEDDLSAPAEGKAKIRFIHLSPDAPALDFRITGEDAPLASDKEFKEFTGFVTIDADVTYTFNMVVHGTNEVVHTFDFKPKNDMIYTVWAKGLMERVDHGILGFGHGILTH